METLIAAILGIIGKVLPNTADKNAAIAKLTSEEIQAELQSSLEQLKINEAEATSESVFTRGWRPLVGWICGIGLMYNTLILSVVKSTIAFSILFGLDSGLAKEVQEALPSVDMHLLGSILAQLLGIGGLAFLRTKEKINQASLNAP